MDDFSRMTWIYLLKLKSDVCVAIKYFMKFVQTQFNKIVKVCGTDNITEFVNDNCCNLFKDLGIIHQRTCAYSPQQNGITERKHKHIPEVTRALRFQANIPLRFWGHYVVAAVYIINRLPSSILGMSPYQKLFNKPPFLTYIKVLGCLCYAKRVNQFDKLQPRTKSTVFMGYSEVQKGYILYDIDNKSFFVNKDVTFRETKFPFKTASIHTPIF